MDRSGIGLFGELLDAHPEVAITRRLNFWEFFAGRFGDLGDPRNRDRCVAAMMRYTRISRLEPDADRLVADFSQGEATYARLFEALERQNMERLGKRRWGDKSLGSEARADEILGAFPQAVMVHVVRDPRDRFASQSNHRSAGRGGIGSGAAAWLRSTDLATRNTRVFADRYLAVRYEDLVRNPLRELTKVCAVAQLEFSPAMLDDGDGPRPFHTDSIGRFRTDLRPAEIAYMERVLGPALEAWGYEASSVEPGVGGRLRFAVTGWPVAAMGRRLWDPWTRLRTRVGRRPSSRRIASGMDPPTGETAE
jgi:hypothetical protein